eukprot:gnl/TRDRNA2_/TRDRNA2_44663_c0_seq1.p1 gnl/TRDRNA2_/TRDRNA2_44663_c0~~gnl/TRDRNA2_/TRDRNA2_44663_c0_seq1.p1  ORF type:complete len:112 (-),score=18.53 gnl/TRDRNA2_/TRDRNA2_44663_c0_seq1:249-584(-)
MRWAAVVLAKLLLNRACFANPFHDPRSDAHEHEERHMMKAEAFLHHHEHGNLCLEEMRKVSEQAMDLRSHPQEHMHDDKRLQVLKMVQDVGAKLYGRTSRKVNAELESFCL